MSKCAVLECSREAQEKKWYWFNTIMSGWEPTGVRACVQLCKQCDDEIHGLSPRIIRETTDAVCDKDAD